MLFFLARRRARFTPVTAPSTPGSFSGSSTSVGYADLTWTDVTGESEYELEYGSAPSFFPLATLPPGTISYTHSITGPVDVDYRIRANNGGGRSAWSSTITVSVL
jgi:hypothetical protein